MNELKQRCINDLLALFGSDEAWSERAAWFRGSIIFGGYWVNEKGVFNTYAEAVNQ